MKKNLIFPSLVFFLLLFIAWELFSRSTSDLILVLPPPSKIILTLFQYRDRLFLHASVTLFEMVASLFIALISSLPLVWGMVRFPKVGAVVQTLFILFQSLPAFCLAPLLVMWFGWHLVTIIIPSSLMMLFPLTMSIYKGLGAPKEAYLEYFRLHGATKKQIFLKLQLPFALPHFFSGLRIALAISGIGAIAGEWMAGNSGLGVLMVQSRQSMDYEMTFASFFVLSIITIGLYLIGIFFEKRCWNMYRSSLQFLKWCTVSACAFVMMLLCPSCHQENPPEMPSGKVELMLDWMPNPDHVPLFVGKKLKFFEEENIDLNMRSAFALDPLQPLITKQTDLVISYFPRTIAACDKGAEFKIIGKLIAEPLDCIVVLEGSGIRTPIDLSGKVIGLGDFHFSNYFLDTMLSSVVTSPAKKQNVNFDLTAALALKQVDAIYGACWNIEPEQMASMGLLTRFFSVTEFGVPPYDELVFVAKKGTYCATPAFAARFQKALQKSIDYCIAHPKEAFEIYFAQNPDKTEKVRAWEEKAWRCTIPVLPRSQRFSEERVKTFIRWAHSKGIIVQEPRLEECIDSLES